MFAVIALVLGLIQTQGNLSIEGTVRDPSGALIPGVLVLMKTDDKLQDWAVTNEAGKYRLSDVTPGKHDLMMLLPGFTILQRSLVLTASTKEDATLSLPSIDTCACIVTAEPDVTIPLQAAMSELRRITLRVEDRQPSSVPYVEGVQLLDDFRSLGIHAVPALSRALYDSRPEVRLNALVVLFDFTFERFGRKPVDIHGAVSAIGQCIVSSDSTLREYARATLERALKVEESRSDR